MEILSHEREIYEYEKTVLKFKKQNQANSLLSPQELEKLESKLLALKKKVYSRLTSWQRVSICRHPKRPRTRDYLKNVFTEFSELSGDRYFGDDRALIGGLAKIGDLKCLVIGQEKGHDTDSRVKHNFGMMSPEGFRKALRLMKLAEKFALPIISFLDTPGAYPGLSAEERGQGWAIAYNLREMASLRVPILSIVIGEGCSGGALGIGVGNALAMLEHSYYSVISPEGCASILWKDANKNHEAAQMLKLNAENLLEYGIIDCIIKEALGGAHHDPQVVYKGVKSFILEQYESLKTMTSEELVDQRYTKFRNMGCFNIN